MLNVQAIFYISVTISLTIYNINKAAFFKSWKTFIIMHKDSKKEIFNDQNKKMIEWNCIN